MDRKRNGLEEIYYLVYNNNPDFTDFGNRMKMQKAIYLLEEMGLYVKNYNFIWYKHGPYSQNLQYDILTNYFDDKTYVFSREAMNIMSNLNRIVNKKSNYSSENWVEALASIEYLRSRMFINDSYNKYEILNKLKRLKSHLNDDKENEKAFDAVTSII